MFPDVLLLLCVAAYMRRRPRTRRYWVHPMLQERRRKGQFRTLYRDLRHHPEKFFGYTRMSVSSFDGLLAKLKDALRRQDTNFRLAITPTERLLITLRFLATGHSYAALHYQFLMGRSTIRYLVLDTCKLIWKVLQPEFMPTPDVPMWEANMQLFWEKHDFPNCLGAVDGKHVRLVMPAFTGSLYYNYKKLFSLVLMAVVDPNLKFIYVDVGAYGSSHDSSVFQHSRFGVKLRTGQMTLPPPRPWPDTVEPPYPCVFVADEAFALSEHVMRPYAQRDMIHKKVVFNNRLTKARQVVECAFGILANKWRIYHTAIKMQPKYAIIVVKATCILHNYVRTLDSMTIEEEEGDLSNSALVTLPPATLRGPISAIHNRDKLADYFVP
ncbi:uncharacterized protein [Hyperolius riggenbachi]|uniref:uncharacterized protein n=1 Tax=Hyperolius riggenbachi TaxID=752182 RepID=UPI0035A3D046